MYEWFWVSGSKGIGPGQVEAACFYCWRRCGMAEVEPLLAMSSALNDNY